MSLLMLLCGSASAQTLFVFNPEAKVSRLGEIIKILEDSLKSRGLEAKVYMFASPKDFQNSVERFNPDLAIVASYYYVLMKETYQWKALLSGHYNRAKVFRKVLVAPGSFSEAAQLVGKSLATVSLGASSLPYIQTQLPGSLSVERIKIVSVSKDVDAVMALGLGQVDAALVTGKSFESLKETHPELLGELHILQELNPVEYPKIAAFPRAKAVEEFTQVFKNMAYEGNTVSALEFFGVTGFDTE